MDRASLFSKKDVKEFQALYEQFVGEELDTKSAYMKLAMLVRLVEVTHYPLTNEYGNGNGNRNVTSRNYGPK